MPVPESWILAARRSDGHRLLKQRSARPPHPTHKSEPEPIRLALRGAPEFEAGGVKSLYDTVPSGETSGRSVSRQPVDPDHALSAYKQGGPKAQAYDVRGVGTRIRYCSSRNPPFTVMTSLPPPSPGESRERPAPHVRRPDILGSRGTPLVRGRVPVRRHGPASPRELGCRRPRSDGTGPGPRGWARLDDAAQNPEREASPTYPFVAHPPEYISSRLQEIDRDSAENLLLALTDDGCTLSNLSRFTESEGELRAMTRTILTRYGDTASFHTNVNKPGHVSGTLDFTGTSPTTEPPATRRSPAPDEAI